MSTRRQFGAFVYAELIKLHRSRTTKAMLTAMSLTTPILLILLAFFDAEKTSFPLATHLIGVTLWMLTGPTILFLVAEVLANEFEQQTVRTVMSRGAPRWLFLTGKWVALLIVAILNALLCLLAGGLCASISHLIQIGTVGLAEGLLELANSILPGLAAVGCVAAAYISAGLLLTLLTRSTGLSTLLSYSLLMLDFLTRFRFTEKLDLSTFSIANAATSLFASWTPAFGFTQTIDRQTNSLTMFATAGAGIERALLYPTRSLLVLIGYGMTGLAFALYFFHWQDIEIAGTPIKNMMHNRAFRRQTVRLLGLGLVGMLLLWSAGIGYEAYATKRDLRRYPAPGQLVDIGGHALHLYCLGEGTPTVILEAGGGEWSLSWSLVQAEIAKTSRVCSYDRAGLGWSEAGPEPRTAQRIGAELHMLLQKAGIPSPYVLVGHSAGGQYARMYALEYPSDVAGMVQVDGAQHYQMSRRLPLYARLNTTAWPAELPLLLLRDSAGYTRLWPDPLPPFAQKIPPEWQNAYYALSLSYKHNRAVVQEAIVQMEAELIFEQAKQANQASHRALFGDMPLIVLVNDPDTLSKDLAGAPQPLRTQMRTISLTWQAVQQEAATLSMRGRLQVVPGSGHFIQLDVPDAVIEAVREIIWEVRQP